MYSVVLAAVLSTGGTAPGWDTSEELKDLKDSVEEVRKGQTKQRVEALKQTIADLRQRLIEQKLDDLRWAVEEVKHGGLGVLPYPVPVMPRVAPSSGRATVHLKVPAGATVTVNDKDISLPSPSATFVTPVLEPGREYYYDFKVTAREDGKPVTRTKRVTVRAGAVVRVAYEEMEAR